MGRLIETLGQDDPAKARKNVIAYVVFSEHTVISSEPSAVRSEHTVISSEPTVVFSKHTVISSEPSAVCSGHTVVRLKPQRAK
ncbi:MAG: hypothetical protein LBK00_06655 [Treponema sp.]|nr:hypothetical protein [Treponema sp.]